MTKLKDYQDDAADRLLENFDHLLQSSESEICILEAPTGSGKTITVADFLKRFVKDRKDDKKYSFVWISVRRLHVQSKDKLLDYYKNRELECSEFNDLLDNKIDENEILFLNWESIKNQDRNIIVKEDKETENNLRTILDNTKEEGREVILIIDESHYAATTEKALEVINLISPKLTLEVSATPQIKTARGHVPVLIEHVKQEEMIKSDILVNPEFGELESSQKNSTQTRIVIKHALEKREELKKLYQKEKSNVNPLILIQLPDKKDGHEEKRDEVEKILKSHNITVDNGKLAIWLSKEKTSNLPNIEVNNNEVEVLIFKQAIGLGWDCPRASILVIFRESKSIVFTKQVIGRIMRMPEQKYYPKHPQLNNGFIFTNLDEVEARIKDEFAKDYLSIYTSKRNDTLYNDISLHSIFLKSKKERPRLTREFSEIFLDLATKKKLKDKITYPPSDPRKPVVKDGIISNIDKIGEIKHKGEVNLKLGAVEISKAFNNYIADLCSPFSANVSTHWMKETIYGFLDKNFGEKAYGTNAQKVILEQKNLTPVFDVIRQAKQQFTEKVVKKTNEKREIIENNNWEVPKETLFSKRHQQDKAPTSIMQPLYVQRSWKPEEHFIKSLQKSKNVKWWYKNGEKKPEFFAVIYQDQYGVNYAFYVDFIVQFKDDSIGLFDTKADRTAEDSGPKSDGLQKFIRQQKKAGKKIWGGIAVENVGGEWLYYDKPKYVYNKNDFSDWKALTL